MHLLVFLFAHNIQLLHVHVLPKCAPVYVYEALDLQCKLCYVSCDHILTTYMVVINLASCYAKALWQDSNIKKILFSKLSCI